MKLVATFSLLGIIIIAASMISTTKSQDTTITDVYCSPNQYAPDDPYGLLVEDLTMALSLATPTKEDFVDYLVSYNFGQEVYGKAQCNDERLSQEECHICLAEAAFMSRIECPDNSKGVEIQMVDCVMKYDDHQFWED